MDAFSEEKFMLGSKTARELFRGYAKDAPIVDYHCHIDAREIAEDLRFENITQLWLRNDHYKWRLMRAAGVDERLITGDATDREKFDVWAFVIARAVGNPLFHWSHLELKRYFGFSGVLSEITADEVCVRGSTVNTMKDEPAHGSLQIVIPLAAGEVISEFRFNSRQIVVQFGGEQGTNPCLGDTTQLQGRVVYRNLVEFELRLQNDTGTLVKAALHHC